MLYCGQTYDSFISTTAVTGRHGILFCVVTIIDTMTTTLANFWCKELVKRVIAVGSCYMVAPDDNMIPRF